MLSIEANQEILISYGDDRTNVHMVRDYGFVLQGNSNDTCLAMLRNPHELPKITRRHMLLQTGYRRDNTLPGNLCWVAGPPVRKGM